MINEQHREILVIAQEEAAEVIQEISKILRFGLDDIHQDGTTHRQRLQLEVGDLLCMIDLMIDRKLINPAAIEMARRAKIEKLKKYSNIDF